MTHPLAYLNPDCMVVEDLDQLTLNLRRLANYCEVRAYAMRCRAKGRIHYAQNAEHDCETMYAQLPPEWRW